MTVSEPSGGAIASARLEPQLPRVTLAVPNKKHWGPIIFLVRYFVIDQLFEPLEMLTGVSAVSDPLPARNVGVVKTIEKL